MAKEPNSFIIRLHISKVLLHVCNSDKAFLNLFLWSSSVLLLQSRPTYSPGYNGVGASPFPMSQCPCTGN